MALLDIFAKQIIAADFGDFLYSLLFIGWVFLHTCFSLTIFGLTDLFLHNLSLCCAIFI